MPAGTIPNPGYARSGEKGLRAASVQPPESMIIYSTSPGKVAGDNPAGRNGYFTAALLRYIGEPGLELDDMMKLVTMETSKMSRNQVPWRNSSMTSEFYFGNPNASSSVAALLQPTDTTLYQTASTLEEAVLTTYSGDHNIFGQGAKYPVLAGVPIITVAPLPGGSYQWQMSGSSGSKTVLDGRLQLFPEDMDKTLSSLQSRSAATFLLSLGSDSREFTLSYRPEEIHSWHDLQAMRQNLSASYTQMVDITFPDTDEDGLSDYNFQPIGQSMSGTKKYSGTPFTGTFSGNGHTITGLYISRPTEH